MKSERTVLAVVAHNLGDAVIASGLLRAAIPALPGIKWHIWCRPEVSFLFERLPAAIEVTVNRFPVGTNKQFNFRALLDLLRSIVRFRRIRFDLSFDLLGDFRDVGLAKLAGGQPHLSSDWADGHLFRRIIRRSPKSWVQFPSYIPADRASIYEAYDGVVRDLVLRLGGDPAVMGEAPLQKRDAGKVASQARIGMHPFASQECRLWPDENWRQLAASLKANGAQVLAYSAPGEREKLESIFGGVLAEDEMVSGSLPKFVESVKTLDLLIGLDSFSVHVAHLVNIQSVLLSGPSDPKLWTPPTCTPVMRKVDCGSQPCLNQPTCVGTRYEYICMKSIDLPLASSAIAAKLP